MLCVLCTGDAREAICWCTRICCEEKGVACCELGEVDLSFGLVNNFASETGVHFLPWDALVLDVGAFVEV